MIYHLTIKKKMETFLFISYLRWIPVTCRQNRTSVKNLKTIQAKQFKFEFRREKLTQNYEAYAANLQKHDSERVDQNSRDTKTRVQN